MLPEKFRLERMKDFEILFKEGRFVDGKILSLKIWKMDTAKYPRRKYSLDDLKIGCVVGVKVSKKAVERNRARRQMREAIRLLPITRIAPGYLMAFIAKPPILTASYQDIVSEIESLAKRARILL